MKFSRNASTLHEPLFKPQIEPANHLTDTQAISCPKHHAEHHRAHGPEWPGSPPRGQNLDANPGALAPCPAAGAALDAKYVTPVSQGRVPDRPLAGVHLVPLPFETLQLVPVARL